MQQKLWFRKLSYLLFDGQEYKENTITEYVARCIYGIFNLSLLMPYKHQPMGAIWENHKTAEPFQSL
jgi:hypothetical protein